MMEIDLTDVPPLMVLVLVVWALALLTYRALNAVVESKKTGALRARLLCDDAGPSKCIYRTGEYFLKSSEPCSCTGVISGVVTHISEIDRFRLFHQSPGYSQLEDTLHIRLTGLEISQNREPETCETKGLETVVDVEDYSCSAIKTAKMDQPGENSCLNDGENAKLQDKIHGSAQHNNYVDERRLDLNAFKKTPGSEDIRIQIPKDDTNSSQPISIISPKKMSIFPDNQLPKYGKLNLSDIQKLSGFEIPKKNRISSQEDPHLSRTICNTPPTKQSVNELPTLISNTDIAWNDKPTLAKGIQNQTPDLPNPRTPLPPIQSPMPDNNVIVPPSADPQYPLFDILHEGIAENKSLEDRNPRLEQFLTNGTGQATARHFVGDLGKDNVTSTIIPLHAEIFQQIKARGAYNNPMQIQDTADQLSRFLQGPAVNSPTEVELDPTTNSIVSVSGSNGLELPERSTENIDWGMPLIENPLNNQTLRSECLQIKTSTINNVSGNGEEAMNPLDEPNNFHISDDQKIYSDNIYSDIYSHNDVLPIKACPTSIGSNSTLFPLPVTCPSPHVLSTFNSCGGACTITREADDSNSNGYDELLDSASVKPQMVTSHPVKLDLEGECLSRKNNADDEEFNGKDLMVCKRALDCNEEAIRSTVINRRRGTNGSSSSGSKSTTGDDQFAFLPQ